MNSSKMPCEAGCALMILALLGGLAILMLAAGYGQYLSGGTLFTR